MKKRVVLFLAVLLLLVSVCWPAAEAHAAMMNVHGSCFLSANGKSVTYGGVSSSPQTEDYIKVVAVLYEQRNGTWHEVHRTSSSQTNSNIATTSTTYTVTGGYYYKVIAYHTATTGSTTSSITTNTSSRWISN